MNTLIIFQIAIILFQCIIAYWYISFSKSVTSKLTSALKQYRSLQLDIMSAVDNLYNNQKIDSDLKTETTSKTETIAKPKQEPKPTTDPAPVLLSKDEQPTGNIPLIYDKDMSTEIVPNLAPLNDSWKPYQTIKSLPPFDIYCETINQGSDTDIDTDTNVDIDITTFGWRVFDPKTGATLLKSVGKYSTERTCLNGVKSAKKSLLSPSKTIVQFEVKPSEALFMDIFLRANSNKVIAHGRTSSDREAHALIKRVRALVKRSSEPPLTSTTTAS